MATPSLQNYYDVSSWMYGFEFSDDLPPPPPNLDPFPYDGTQYDSGLLASGFHGAAFVTEGADRQVVIGVEGTDSTGLLRRPLFLLAQIDADLALFRGVVPHALRDAAAFASEVVDFAESQGIPAARITVTGHSLGAAGAAFIAANADLGGVTFAAPGLPLDAIPPGATSSLTNYVEFGDPVANYSFTPTPIENFFIQSPEIQRFGEPTYIGTAGTQASLTAALVAAGAAFAPGTSQDVRDAGLAAFGVLFALYHPLTTYGETLDLQNEVAAIDATRIGTGVNLLRLYGDLSDRSPLVSDAFYGITNPDVLRAGIDAERHYDGFGWREGRDPNAFFATNGYLAANPDVDGAGVNPVRHYDTFGWREGRDASVGFDTTLYLQNNPDVAAAGVDPLVHYLDFGRFEEREAFAAIGRPGEVAAGRGFDAEYYLLANADVAEAALTTPDSLAFARQHYDAFGWREGRDGNAVFDTDGYLAAYGDVRAAGIDPLRHYDGFGWREGRDPSAAFDTTAYLAQNPDVAAAGVNPLIQYLTFGIYEGRSALGDGVFG